MTELIGKTLRGYRLTDHVGSGGFGAVYRATQNVVGREVAIKVILPEFANTPKFVRRFEAEAQFIARLEHPHIIPLFDYWRDPQGAYLVMRYIQGGSLTQLLERRAFSLEETARFLDEITGALSIAHRKGVVHLDLKPDNILFDGDGNAYLTDFGIAKSLDRSESGDEEQISGTIAYAAPEQIKGLPPTPQGDIYSLGLILYEILVGQHAFAAYPPGQMLFLQLTQPAPELVTFRPDLSFLFDDIIQKATAKEPENRYKDVRDIARDFRYAMQALRADIDEIEISPYLAHITNPYKGLRAFEETDADTFFGREELIAQLVGYLYGSNFMAVVGPSGSGKSSLVKAGLIPALRRGAISNSDEWFILEFVPGSTPLINLAAALNSIATRPSPHLLDTLRSDTESLNRIIDDILANNTDDVLLVIDQFEEVFTQVSDENLRAHFLELLRFAVKQSGSRLHLVITLRADFYDRPLHYEGFGTLIQQNTQVVLPLTVQELERAIIGPVERMGMSVDADLIASMIADVREEPGALPLLQYALTEVFERREGERLTLAAYEFSGGVSGALAKRAEEVYNDLDAQQQRIARQIFLRLVTLGEGSEDTRRRVFYSELIHLGNRDQVQAVLDRFGKYRLLTFDTDPQTREPMTEVAHEALIRGWGRLVGWLSESRDDIRLQRLLDHAAVEWRDSDREASFLLRGARLSQYEEWATQTDLSLTEEEHEFLNASLEEHERLEALEMARRYREEELRAHARQRLQQLVVGLAVFSVLSIVLMLFAFNRSFAEREARATSEYNAGVAQTQVALAATAEQRALDEASFAEIEAARAQSLALSTGAQLSLEDRDRDTAVTLALEAIRLPNPPLQTKLILAQIAYSPGTQRRIEFDAPVNAVAMSPDGTMVASGLRSGELALWEISTGDVLALFEGHLDRITRLVFSPDGTHILSGSWDDTAVLWDIETQAAVMTFAGHTDNVLSVAFSSDGSLVLTTSSDGTVRLWDVATGQERFVFNEHNVPVLSADFNPDGQYVISGGSDNRAYIWNLQGEILSTFSSHSDRINAVDFSADGRYFLTASDDSTIRVYNAVQYEPLRVLRGHNDRVLDARFSDDGRFVLSGGRDGTFIVWDFTTGEIFQIFAEHEDSVLSVGGSRNGALMVTGSADDTLRVWTLGAADPVPVRVEAGTNSLVAVSPDGRSWAHAGIGSGTTIRSTAGDYSERVRTIGGGFENIRAITFSADGTLFAEGGMSRTILVTRIEDGEIVQQLAGQHTGEITALAFSTDGRWLFSGSLDASVVVWDVTTGEVVFRFADAHEDGVLALAVHPNGEWLISASNDGSIIVWNLNTGREMLRMLGNRRAVNGLALSPSGDYLYSALEDGYVIEWYVATGRERRIFEGHRDDVLSLAVDPTGMIMLTGGLDENLILWDLVTGVPINRFEVPSVDSIAFTVGGGYALTASQNGTILRWQTLTLDILSEWIAANRYVRPLSCEQRDLYGVEPLCG